MAKTKTSTADENGLTPSLTLPLEIEKPDPLKGSILIRVNEHGMNMVPRWVVSKKEWVRRLQAGELKGTGITMEVIEGLPWD